MPTHVSSSALNRPSALAELSLPLPVEEFLREPPAVRGETERLADAFEACLRSLQETNRRLVAELERRERMEAHLRALAHRDALTALPNRRMLLAEMNARLELRRRWNEGTDAILFLDLDDFKRINDRFGHEAGDRLLAEVAERLRQSTRATDVVGLVESADAARLGGDEFVILLRQLRTPEDAHRIAERILATLSEPLDVYGQAVASGVSIGVAVLDDEIRDAAAWLRKADEAMYRAKRDGKGRTAPGVAPRNA